MHLISEMPDPAAYFANDLTRWEAINENPVYGDKYYFSKDARENGTHGEEHKNNPSRKHDMAPTVPCVAPVDFLAFDLPTTKLLIQPPSVRAVSHSDITQPFADDGDDSRVKTYTHT